VRRSNKMNPKVAASFTIVLTLAMILSANPAMTMSSNIFASSDGGSSSETEQSEVESETGVLEEGTEPETEIINCPDG
jgi:hypothetical protein